MNLYDGEEFDAYEMGETTCMGVPERTEPLYFGNRFNLTGMLHGVEIYPRILNFNRENLDLLFKRGLTFPIRCKTIPGYPRVAVIHDTRIGSRWYDQVLRVGDDQRELWSLPQRFAHQLAVARGEIREEGSADIKICVHAQFQ
jgi:hypothetical protein